MLIESYELEISVSTHSDTDFEYEAIAHLEVDIREVMPYLNATLSRAIYKPGRPSVGWRHDGHNIGFWPDRIAADDLESREHAADVIESLVALVNDTWAQRDEIEPDHTTHERRQPLELYRLLPQTNCKRCGEQTCFAFALKLAAGQVEPAGCLPLYEAVGSAGQRAQLEDLLARKWPTL
ncbi:MAG: (Fe-S)-binding protein [Anaerolineae bacterium]|jgi:ArsR family metal-binding transcriptional regulator